MALNEGHGELTVADVFERINGGSWHLWIIPGVGAGCTHFEEYPAYRTLIIRLWAANAPPDTWVNELSHVEEWAAVNNCRAVEVFGRPGWSRVLDYQVNQVVLRKKL